MKTLSFLNNKRMKVLKIISLITFLLLTPLTILNAQIQSGNFSGNDPSSYSCYNRQGDRLDKTAIFSERDGLFYCDMNSNNRYDRCPSGVYDGGETCDPIAVLNPPTIQVLEIWFVRVIYLVWALAASVSVFGLLGISYQYMISRGAPEAQKVLRDRIAKFIIGLFLVFLAVPILNTIFRLLAVNDTVECYQGLTSNVGIGFQFVFPEMCTSPNLERELTADQVCNLIQNSGGTSGGLYSIQGRACSTPGQDQFCNPLDNLQIRIFCKEDLTWDFESNVGPR